MEYKLGARGLRSICESILTDAMYELPSQKVKTLKLLWNMRPTKIQHQQDEYAESSLRNLDNKFFCIY